MNAKNYILDPLWITKGDLSLDAEYCNYTLLGANKKFRDLLEEGDISKFSEILFHSLNLNNLAIEGSLLDSNFKPFWEDPKLKEIRNSLKKIYQDQSQNQVVEIFRSANLVFTSLLIDYLDEMLECIEKSKIYFVNKHIDRQKDIFLVFNQKGSSEYEVWKLRYDRRYRLGRKLTRIINLEIDSSVDNALKKEVTRLGIEDLESMDANKNVIFSVYKEEIDTKRLAFSLFGAISFSRGIGLNYSFSTDILGELHDILTVERVLPFTIKEWV